MATKSGFPDLLTPVFRKIFYNEYTAYESENNFIPKLYNVGTSGQHEEQFSQVGAMGNLHRLDNTGKVVYDEPVQGYDTSIQFPEYAKGFTIKRSLYDDDLYNIMNQQPQALALAAARTRQEHAAVLFNNATATTWSDDGKTVSIAGGDGVSLCSDSHTFATGDTNAVTDNYGTLSLSADNLDTVRQAMRAFTDDRGNLLMVKPNTVLIPPELEKTMYEIGASDKVPSEFSNTANFMYNRFQVIVWDLLTDANMWFMIDSNYMKLHLHWYDRVRPELGEAEDFDQVSAKWRVYGRWGFGFSDWRWIYGCNPS